MKAHGRNEWLLRLFSYSTKPVLLIVTIALSSLFAVISIQRITVQDSMEEKQFSPPVNLSISSHADSNASLHNDDNLPKFFRRDEVKDIDCARLFAGDEEYLNETTVNRTTVHDSPNLDMSCDAVRQRIIGKYPAPEVNYSVAFARVVYQDYEFFELQLSVSYSEENHFCFVIDSSSEPLFQHRVRTMGGCFPNVYIPDEVMHVDHSGQNGNLAHMQCMKVLLQNGKWDYVMLLHNHDIIIQSNAQLAEIFKILNGTNDVLVMEPVEGRVNKDVKWDMDSLQLFTNDTPLTAEERKLAKLEFAKGYTQVSYSYAAADWMVNKVNLTKMLIQLNLLAYANDEQLASIFHNSETLKIPGGYHSDCLKNKLGESPFFTRYTKWYGDCKSGTMRNSQCVLGLEDLSDIKNVIRPEFLMVNKMLAGIDYGAISCVAEMVFNSTHFDKVPPVNRTFFENSPVVVYNRRKNQGLINIYNYTCT